mmetsp:Transcript_2040/g.4626  ORF Transcript_2040/g.4626 Transcript_2040/m.4626 type:complete len:887 (-) Transcript_2040:125-2785(-)
MASWPRVAERGHACLPFLFSLLAALLAGASASVVRDWCPTQKAFHDSENTLMALEGKTIKAGATIYPPFSVLDESTGEWSGFDIEVFREVAKRGKFDVEFIRLNSPAENETWDDVLFTQGREMDIMCTWWGETFARKKRGIAFTYPILDQSLILATPIPKRVQRTFLEQFWVFLQPFSRSLWLTLLFGNLFTAIVVFILDPHIMLDAWTKSKGNRRMSENYYPTSGGMLNWCKYALVNISNFFYQGWVLGTTQVPYQYPRNPWIKLYLMSWTSVLIVSTAAYTAQLTSFLLIDSRPVDSIDNMDDVTDSGLPVCAGDNIPFVRNFFLNSAPSVPVVSIPTVDQAFPGIRNQECAAALAGKAELELLLAENQKCDMRIVGRTLKDVSGALAGDTSNCGSFVVQVIGGHVQQLAQEGLLENIWSTYITRPPECAWAKFQSARKEGQKNQLQLEALGGLFIIHAAFSFLALAGFSVQKFLQPKKVTSKDESFLEDSERGTPEGPLQKIAESSKSMKFSGIQMYGKQLTKSMASFGRVSTISKIGDSDCGVSPTGPSYTDPSHSGGGKKCSSEMPRGGPTAESAPSQWHVAVPPSALGSIKGKVSPEGGPKPPTPSPTEPSLFAQSSSQTPLKSSMAKQPSDVLPPKLGMRAVGFTPRGLETPAGAAQQALQAPHEQRGSARGVPGSPRSSLEASPAVTTNNNVLGTDDLIKLQDDLSRANSFSNLAAGSSPKHLGSSGGSQELGLGSNTSPAGSQEGENLLPSSMPDPAEHQSTSLGQAPSQDLGGIKLGRVSSRSRLSTSSAMAGLVPPTEQLEPHAPLLTPRASAALGLDPAEVPAASRLAEGGAGEAAGHPAQHVVKQQTLFAPEEDADAVKPFKLEEDDRESHAE